MERSQGEQWKEQWREQRRDVPGGDVCGLKLRLSWSWFLVKHFSKQAGWSVGYGEIRIVKGGLLIPNLVTCYSRDAQRDWIECLSLVEVIWTKVRISKRCANNFSQEVEEFKSRVKYRYMIIDRLISIKAL